MHGGRDKARSLTSLASGFQQGEAHPPHPQASLTELAVLSALVAQGMNVVDQCLEGMFGGYNSDGGEWTPQHMDLNCRVTEPKSPVADLQPYSPSLLQIQSGSNGLTQQHHHQLADGSHKSNVNQNYEFIKGTNPQQ